MALPTTANVLIAQASGPLTPGLRDERRWRRRVASVPTVGVRIIGTVLAAGAV
jgi:hypothetical protein